MELRPELPKLPKDMRHLPVSKRGYPVPAFAAWFKDGRPVERGKGEPDFRIVHPAWIHTCITQSRCWVCGKVLSFIPSSRPTVAYVSGPMCGVNRTSAEPPSHVECARFSAKACPFLARPHARRRDNDLEGTLDEHTPGIAIDRNPGVAMVWLTRNPGFFQLPDGGILFKLGDPVAVEWYARGREATREEVEESVDTGLPILMNMAEEQGPDAVAELGALVEEFRNKRLPVAS